MKFPNRYEFDRYTYIRRVEDWHREFKAWLKSLRETDEGLQPARKYEFANEILEEWL